MMSNQIFGIDLGTTNTALSYLYVMDGRSSVNLIKNRDGGELTPSVVYFQPNSDKSIVGKAALSMYTKDPDRTFRWVKREMGKPIKWNVSAGAKPVEVNPETISARILKSVCEDAKRNLELEAPITDVYYSPCLFRRCSKTSDPGCSGGCRSKGLVNRGTDCRDPRLYLDSPSGRTASQSSQEGQINHSCV